ncbi:helix-turn-helix transcriptional regulator [Flavobacterium sp.]
MTDKSYATFMQFHLFITIKNAITFIFITKKYQNQNFNFNFYWYILIFFYYNCFPKRKKKMIKVKLQAKRLEKQLSQEEIADLLCMTQSTYSRKEKGITKITMGEWTKIAKVLQVEMEEIYEPAVCEKKLDTILQNQYKHIPFYLQQQIDSLLKENIELEEKLRSLKNQ